MGSEWCDACNGSLTAVGSEWCANKTGRGERWTWALCRPMRYVLYNRTGNLPVYQALCVHFRQNTEHSNQDSNAREVDSKECAGLHALLFALLVIERTGAPGS